MTRTELILHIFADRARTGEGQLQVELAPADPCPDPAHPRLDAPRPAEGRRQPARRWRDAARNGPADAGRPRAPRARSARARPSPARPKPSTTQPGAASPRWRWRATPTPASPPCSNALTADGVHAADQMFATLDPTMRRWQVGPGAELVLGRYRRLHPRTAGDAGGCLQGDARGNCRSGSHPPRHRRIVAGCRARRGSPAACWRKSAPPTPPTIEVFNKADLLDGDAQCLGGMTVSALRGHGPGRLARHGGGPPSASMPGRSPCSSVRRPERCAPGSTTTAT